MLALLVDHSELLPFLFAAVSVLLLLPAYLVEAFLRKHAEKESENEQP